LKAPNTNFGTSVDIILDRETTDKHVGVVNFDLSNLTCYATLVRSATLKMYRTAGTDQVISLYQITKPWSEYQVTWNNRLTPTPWTTQGGDYNSGNLIDATGTPVSNIYNWNATGIIHNMVCSTYLYPNYGFIIRVDATGGNRTTTFASRENTTAGIIKPSLLVTFDSAAFICLPIPVRAPMAMPDTAATNSNNSILINAIINDQLPGSNTGTISLIAGSVTSGSASLSGNNISYIPNPTFQGITSFQYVVTDNVTGLKDTASVFILVSYPAPIANNDYLTIFSNGSGSVNILTNDIDLLGLGLTTSILSGPKRGITTQTGTTITYTAPFNFYGKDTITYRIANSVGGLCNEQIGADTAIFVITVLNRPPDVRNDTVTTNPCQPVIIDVLKNDSDPENGSININSVSSVNPVAAGTATTDGNLIYFTPNASFAGSSATLTYIIADDALPPATSATATVTINFQNSINLPPLARNDSISGIYNSDSYIGVLDNDSDPENDALTVLLSPGLLQPVHGTISVLANGLIKYTPAAGFTGIDQFEYKITDSHFGFSGGSCLSVAQTAKGRVYIVIANTLIVLSQNKIQLVGKSDGMNNWLTWSVSENDMPVTYVVEKSDDGRNYETIKTIKQNNPVNTARQYEYLDNKVAASFAFYRIKMLVANQSVIYSNTVVLKNSSKGEHLQIYPVPFQNQFTIYIHTDTEENITARIYNAQGAMVSQKSFKPQQGYNSLIFDQLEEFSPGVYNLTLQQNKVVYKEKIMKIR
jgi:hypothetical protein